MQKWEYRILNFEDLGVRHTTVFDSGLTSDVDAGGYGGDATMRTADRAQPRIYAKYLNALGEEGWELVGV